VASSASTTQPAAPSATPQASGAPSPRDSAAPNVPSVPPPGRGGAGCSAGFASQRDGASLLLMFALGSALALRRRARR
jgi:hypothetical protein